MKKILLILLLLAILLSLGYVFFLKPLLFPALDLLALVPSEAILYLDVKDMEKTWSEVKESNFYSEMQSLSLWRRLGQQEPFASLLSDKRKWEEKSGVELSEKNVMEFMGREAALALMKPGEGSIEPEALFMCRIGMKPKLMEAFAKTREKLKEENRISTLPYRGVDINTVKKPEEQRAFHYAIMGEVALFSNKDEPLKRAVDLSIDKGHGGLSTKPSFSKVADRAIFSAPQRKMTAFVDVKEVKGLMGVLAPLFKGEEGLEIEELQKALMPYEALFLEATIHQKGLRLDSQINYDPAQVSPEMSKKAEMKPRKPDSLKAIPKGSLMFISNNSVNATEWWQNLESQLAQNPQSANKLANLKKFLREANIEVERDILPQVGQEVSFCILDVSAESSLMPVPRLVLWVKVKDVQKAEETLNQLSQNLLSSQSQNPLTRFIKPTLEKEIHEGVPLNYLPIPLLPVSPGYAVVDNFLMLATDLSAQKAMVETYHGKSEDIEADLSYQVIQESISEKNNEMAYVNFRELLEVSQTLLSSPLLELRFQKGLLTDVSQLSEVMKVIKALGWQAIYEKDGPSGTAFIALEDLPKR